MLQLQTRKRNVSVKGCFFPISRAITHVGLQCYLWESLLQVIIICWWISQRVTCDKSISTNYGLISIRDSVERMQYYHCCFVTLVEWLNRNWTVGGRSPKRGWTTYICVRLLSWFWLFYFLFCLVYMWCCFVILVNEDSQNVIFNVHTWYCFKCTMLIKKLVASNSSKVECFRENMLLV